MPEQALPVPLLTELDAAESAEGGIDPLGLYTIADALGVRLVPGVRQRQKHPRFVTLTAVSLDVCREFDDEAIAADGVSEPWLVFEWYVVEGLARTSDGEQLVGLPGSLKAAKARHEGVPLSAKRYLKTPSVFGFHGIYRLLARTVGVDTGGRLGEAGYELLDVWAKEQGLDGFVGTAGGPGDIVRRRWADALGDGLERAATKRSGAWDGWDDFHRHLGIYGAGRKERKLLTSMLLNDPVGFRRELIEFLTSPPGRELWESTSSERAFHAALRPAAGEGLRALLDAIDWYETFARLCQDAFDDCLFEMTRRQGTKTSREHLGQLPSVRLASERLPAVFGEVQQRLEPFGEAARFQALFGGLAEPLDPASWAERLADHHRRTQRGKPPAGKLAWFERYDDGRYMIRPLYRRDAGGAHDDSYVHAYRTDSLWSFARDLKLV